MTTSKSSLGAIKDLPKAIRGALSSSSSLTEPLFFLSEHQAQVIRTKNLTLLLPYVDYLPCWVPYTVVSQAMGYSDNGVRARAAVIIMANKSSSSLKQHNDTTTITSGVFCWCSEFENVHSTWNIVEPGFDFDLEAAAAAAAAAAETNKTNHGRKTTTPTTKIVHFRGSEQFYQLCKAGPIGSFAFVEHAPRFTRATDMEAFSLGRRLKLRHDWESAKDEMMVVATREKFRQNDRLKELLLSTYPLPLASIKSDSYWGCGTDGKSGRNQLGVTLMQVREELMNEKEP